MKISSQLVHFFGTYKGIESGVAPKTNWTITENLAHVNILQKQSCSFESMFINLQDDKWIVWFTWIERVQLWFYRRHVAKLFWYLKWTFPWWVWSGSIGSALFQWFRNVYGGSDTNPVVPERFEWFRFQIRSRGSSIVPGP